MSRGLQFVSVFYLEGHEREARKELVKEVKKRGLKHFERPSLDKMPGTSMALEDDGVMPIRIAASFHASAKMTVWSMDVLGRP